MKETFANAVAVVTGGASGIGRGLCEKLASYGATVVIADIDRASGEKVAAEIVARGGSATFVACDVRRFAEVDALLAETLRRHGRFTHMFNNAGVTVMGEVRDMLPEDWDAMIDVNVKGVANGVQAAYPRMVAQGYGHIVNTASTAGLIPHPVMIGYATTKHAVVGLSISLRVEARALGVKVTVVCPSSVNTPMIEKLTLRRVDKAGIFADPAVSLMPVERCIDGILAGVARNEGLVIFPRRSRVIHLLHRLAPGVFAWYMGQRLVRFRQTARTA
ncbi:MAG: SDR family NAD(P)-dependent oxidoreductase [Rhizomicrobium sp.]